MNEALIRNLTAEELIPELMNYLVSLGAKAEIVQAVQEKLETIREAAFVNGFYEGKSVAIEQYDMFIPQE